LASESCSRIATINYQEVLVDSSSCLKGEGLRSYLQEDAKALEYLDKYQQNSKPGLKSSILSTTGIVLSLLSMTTDQNKSSLYNSNVLLTTGLSMILINFIYNKTYQDQNEKNLQRALDEYNSKHDSKIDLGPTARHKPVSEQTLLYLSFSKDF
jgi:hypothetical protein